MIVALKELSIRGDIRTTVEYLVKMLQSEDFVQNRFNTDWLDARLARHGELMIEENAKYCPPPTLVALCGAALQGFQHFEERGKEFIAMLRVGQVPSKETLAPSVNIDLIFNNVKYRLVSYGLASKVSNTNLSNPFLNINSLSELTITLYS
jgi:acetyl-CoA carboxylase/biotin carboxylase 1